MPSLRPRPSALPMFPGKLAAVPPTPPPRRYPEVDAKFIGAVVQAEDIRGLSRKNKFSERKEVRVKPAFDTACWSYLPPHSIYMGADMLEKPTVRKGLTKEDQELYVLNHYKHELAHARWTIRDLVTAQQDLLKIGVPFSLWNLFEDAYIEERSRVEDRYFFYWTKYELVKFSPRPESVFFALIQHEGDEAAVLSAIEAEVETLNIKPIRLDAKGLEVAQSRREALLKWYPRVVPYYRRAVKAECSEDLFPLLQAWVEEFGKQETKELSDLFIGFGLQLKPETVEQFNEGTEVVSGSPAPKKDDKDFTSGKAMPESNVPEIKKGSVLSKKPTTVPWARAEKIAATLGKAFRDVVHSVGTWEPNRKFSARHAISGRAPFRVKEVLGKARQKVVFIFELSGSMRGKAVDEGRVLLAAVNILAQKGYIEGHVIFCNTEAFETYRFPLGRDVIERVAATNSAEGLKLAIDANLKLVRQAERVMVYTDADIADLPMDREFLHMRSIFTWGLYAGQDQNAKDHLLEHFDKAIMRDNAEALADALLLQLR